MNDEIKEILDRLDFEEWEVDLYKVPITWCELYNIRDYITNLQQENERLKENNQSYQKEMARTWKIADDYKSRIEKAVEYINKYDNIKAYYEYVECGYDEYNYDDDFKTDLLNILQNGSDEK